MGWNRWDCYGPNVTEAEVKANADFMAANLKQYGCEYIFVDIRWYVANDKSHGYNETDPQYSIDSFGRFQPAVNRFPSSENGKGFKPLADYLHSKGLKLGIHIMRGIPVVAVKTGCPSKALTERLPMFTMTVCSAHGCMICTWWLPRKTVRRLITILS